MKSQTGLAVRPVDRTTAGDEIDHVTCCLDDDLGLCSADLTDVGWGDGVPTCVVCVDLCNGPFCPKHGECPPDE